MTEQEHYVATICVNKFATCMKVRVKLSVSSETEKGLQHVCCTAAAM